MAANDHLAALHDRLTAQVEDLVDSDRWKQFLAVAARFHRYSANNVLLLLSQMPSATRVAGYRLSASAFLPRRRSTASDISFGQRGRYAAPSNGWSIHRFRL